MKHPIWRLLLLLAVMAAGWMYAYFQGGYTAYHVWNALKILALIIIIQQAAPLRRLHVTRTLLPKTAEEGDTVTVTLHMAFRSWWPWAWVGITDPLPPSLKASHHPSFMLAVWPHRQHELRYQLVNVPRGIYVLGSPSVASGDVFGLWTRSRTTATLPDTLTVWPKILTITQFGSLLQQWSGNSESHRRLTEDSSRLFGIRDYVAGDRLAQIHWRTSARTGAFKVKQFEPFTQPHIRLVLDAQSAFDSPEHWELAIAITAALLSLGERRAQSMGLLWVDDGDGRLNLGTGREHFEQAMDYLAGLPQFENQRPAPSPVSFVPGDAIAVWITQRGQHRAMIAESAVIAIGPQLDRLDDLPFYLEHGGQAANPDLAHNQHQPNI